MSQEFHKDVTITSKGQLTLPVRIRSALKLGAKRKVRVTVGRNGVVTLEPLPDVMSFFGKLHSAKPYDRDEKSKAREEMGRRGFAKGS